MQDLIDYYENIHSKLGIKVWKEANCKPLKYVRRYLHPLADPMPDEGKPAEPEYDVAMELWFESKDDWEKMLEVPASHYEEIMEDDAKFLDRIQRRVFVIEEHESNLD